MSRIRFKVPPVYLRAQGQLACFTDPSKPTERISLGVPTPSAIGGLLECIHWKPRMRWIVCAIIAHKQIRYYSETRNEVKTLGVYTKGYKNGNFDIVIRNPAEEKYRTLRRTTYLYDVDYTIVARVVTKCGDEDEIRIHQNMAIRRINKGQWFRQPTFGISNCPAEIGPSSRDLPRISTNHDFGMMHFGWRKVLKEDIPDGQTPICERLPITYPAKMVNGVVEVPPEYYKITRPDWPIY